MLARLHDSTKNHRRTIMNVVPIVPLLIFFFIHVSVYIKTDLHF